MKRIFLIVGLAFGCSSVYAQIVQVGDGNSSTILSNTTNPASNIKVLQLFGNKASGTQGPDLNAPGMGLKITLQQRNIGAVTPTLYNFFQIMQQGTTNEIIGDQIGFNNGARVTQGGTLTQSLVRTSQSGNNNAIIVNQQNGVDYRATVRQGPAIPVAALGNPPVGGSLTNTIRNTVVLDQIGESGTADIVQAGSFSRFGGVQKGGTPFQPNTMTISMDNLSAIDVDQDGVGSNIRIVQNGWQYARVTQGQPTVRNNAVILQGANRLQDTRNTAIITQNMGDSNQATVDQSASTAERNDTRIIQNGSRVGAGNNSEITVLQTGQSSRAILTQTETSRGSEIDIDQSQSLEGKGSYAEVTQGGQDNDFEVDQIGSLHIVMGTQEGVDNQTDITQEGQKNRATVNQDGSDNNIDINQENEPSSGVGNRATAIQGAPSSDSDITINQNTSDGDENVATVEQTRGDRNEATVSQDAGNTATVTQSGSEYQPLGQGSSVNVNQSNSTDGTATATQALGTLGGAINITQVEEDNEATVNQTNGRLNVATVNQTDDGNTATVNQSGTQDGPGGAISTVTINQIGKAAMATVTQAANGSTVDVNQENADMAEVIQRTGGATNSVVINQAGTLAGGGNKAKVDQGGDDNVFNVTQTSVDGADGNVVEGTIGAGDFAMQKGQGNTATVTQDGPINHAAVMQDGEQNTITIDQESEAASGVGNKATAMQGANTADNVIAIDQAVNNGSGNTAVVNQTKGDNNLAVVNQLKGNMATITQSGDDADVLGVPSTAIIEQSTSTGGTATILQADGTLGNGALITQTDINNVATINQLAGIVNQAASIQIGERNRSTINQSGSFNVLTLTPSNVAVAQTGNDNTATATQAVGTQAGQIAILQIPLLGSPSVNGNVATVNQNAGTGNLAAITQNDDLNTATITQTGTTDAGSGDPSAVAIVQGGKGGTVTVTQAADGSNVLATQFNGNRNMQTIDQADLGRQLDAITFQNGDDNTLRINQSGQENVSSIVQSNLLLPADPANGPSMHTATLTQGGTVNEAVIGQGGLKNTATLTQTGGEESFASVLQYGSDNRATANQTSSQRNNTLNVTQGRVAGAVPATRATRNAGNLTGALLGLAPADVVQSEDNVALVNQTTGENQVINLIQSGDNEQATISQAGSDNNNSSVQAGEVDRLFHTQTGSQGRIIASQYGEETDKGNTQTITQGGNNNTVDVGQIKFFNVATITQSGQDNNLLVGSTVRQIGESNQTILNQTGRRGNIAVIQGNAAGLTFGGQTLASTGYDPTTNDAFRNTTGINQGGLDNLIAVAQQGDDGTATANQEGNDNFIGIRQLNPGAGILRAVFNVATATQTAGVSNSEIDIEQFGRRNNGSASQTGTGVNNTIALNQRNDDNTATLSQNQGNQNVINVNQNPNAGKIGGNVEIAQSGQDNKARLTQTGYENELTLTQTGDRNVLQQNGANPFALQGGNNNTATLSQTGQDHTINLNQSGMNNTIMVTQANL